MNLLINILHSEWNTQPRKTFQILKIFFPKHCRISNHKLMVKKSWRRFYKLQKSHVFFSEQCITVCSSTPVLLVFGGLVCIQSTSEWDKIKTWMLQILLAWVSKCYITSQFNVHKKSGIKQTHLGNTVYFRFPCEAIVLLFYTFV